MPDWSALPVLDVTILPRTAGDDVAWIHELVEAYRAEIKTWLVELEGALERGAAPDAMRSAHCLRGGTGNLGGTRARAIASALEAAADAGDLEACRPLARELPAAVDELFGALDGQGWGGPQG